MDPELSGRVPFSLHSLVPVPLTKSARKHACGFRGLGDLCAGVEAAMVLRKRRRRCPPTLSGSDVIADHAHIYLLYSLSRCVCAIDSSHAIDPWQCR